MWFTEISAKFGTGEVTFGILFFTSLCIVKYSGSGLAYTFTLKRKAERMISYPSLCPSS